MAKNNAHRFVRLLICALLAVSLQSCLHWGYHHRHRGHRHVVVHKHHHPHNRTTVVVHRHGRRHCHPRRRGSVQVKVVR